ncbi:response regulator [uncultured Desulfobacter sp.]|uniref:response regulator n=1 Tax=uncultured Desulfobacter sp. TaxID=240139 RepID=UPI0029F47765|nr:response regulator [uncultured Desulfobacter sp.]
MQESMILIVDDQPNNIKVLISFLKSQNFQTRIAESGERALQLLDRFLPDLILLDVMMPGMNGFETCREIKTDEKKADIPIVFMTALDNIEDKVQGFKAGGVDYITKPFDQTEMLARINTHIELRRKTIALETAIDEIKTLNGLLPICAHCKKIRDDKGYWNLLETYIERHTQATFSHGVCPECMDKLYGKEDWYIKKKNKRPK